MSVYVMIIEDRHTDVDVAVFATLESAVAAAEEAVDDNARFPNWREVIDQYEVPGRLFYAVYSPEGDCVSVVERVVQ
jgi:hypothetical protein